MLEPRSLLKRIANLETLAKRLRTRSRKGYLFVLADKDSDGDYDPLTAAAWEDSTKSGSGTINWNSVFGVPTTAKMVVVQAKGYDLTVGTAFSMKAKSSTINYPFIVRVQASNQTNDEQGLVPIAADGTSYYFFGGAWDYFTLRVVGWYV